VSSTWSVTMTLRGSPDESTLIQLDEKLPWDGIVAAIPRWDQFTVTTTMDAPEFRKAEDAVIGAVLAMVSEIGIVPEVVGVETLEQAEYDRRAEEPSMPKLVSAPEVAEMLGVSRQRVHQLLSENRRFPEPLLRLGAGPLWVADAVRRFDEQWDRKPGRPGGPATKAG
jgi:predicted DNA-binding transcriptional regulator AlpA